MDPKQFELLLDGVASCIESLDKLVKIQQKMLAILQGFSAGSEADRREPQG